MAYLRKTPFTAEERSDIVSDVRAAMIAAGVACVDRPVDWGVALVVLRRICAERSRRRRVEVPLSPNLARVHGRGEPLAVDENRPCGPFGDDPLGWIEEALPLLPFKERYAVDYRWGWDYEVIAAAIQSSPGGARKAAHLGLKKLRGLWRQHLAEENAPRK